jgi:hypothetical protein
MTTIPMTATPAARAGAATTLIGIPAAATATGALAGAARTCGNLAVRSPQHWWSAVRRPAAPMRRL